MSTTSKRKPLTGPVSHKAARLIAAQFAFLETKEGTPKERPTLLERERLRRAMTADDWRLLSYACGIVMGWALDDRGRRKAA